MLVDFLFATVLAITGLLALSALTTDTLELNRETEAYTVANALAADFAGRWALHQTPWPSASEHGVCGAPGHDWQVGWCSDAASSAYRVLDDMQVCVTLDAGVWQTRVAWGQGDCAGGIQPMVTVPL